MNDPIRPETLIGDARWQQLQQGNAWLKAGLRIKQLRGLSRLISIIPLLKRIVIPRADPAIINSIKDGLMSRKVSETDALLLLGAARIIKLKYRDGELSYQARSGIDQGKLLSLCAAASQSKRQLLEGLTKQVRGRTRDYVFRELQDVNEYRPDQQLVPTPKTIHHFNVARIPKQGKRYLANPGPAGHRSGIPVSGKNPRTQYEQLFLQLRLKDRRLKAEHLPTLLQDGILTEKHLSGNSASQLQSLARQAADHLQLEEAPGILKRYVSIPTTASSSITSSLKTSIPYGSQTSLHQYPKNYQDLYEQLQTMGLVNNPSGFQNLTQQIKPQHLHHPAFISQLLAFNRIREDAGYSTEDFAVMVNQQLLTPRLVEAVLSRSKGFSVKNITRILDASLQSHYSHEKLREERQAHISWHLQQQGLRLQPGSTDGNCFYHAIAVQTGETQSRVRQRMHQKAESLLKSNAQLQPQYGWKEPGDFKRDVQQGFIKNSAPGSAISPHWGSAEQVPLLCVSYKRPVLFYTSLQEGPVCYNSEGIPCSFNSIKDQNPIRLSHHINHWDAIIPAERQWLPEPPAVVHSSQEQMENLIMAGQQAEKTQLESFSRTLPATMLRGSKDTVAVTPGELQQLQNIQTGLQHLRTDAEPGRANSQGFCNAAEYFLRGKGYHQVRSTKATLGPGPKLTPVAGWTPARLADKGMEFDSASDFFQEFNPDNVPASHKRYLLRKSTAGRAPYSQSYYANLVTLGTGRLAVIDAGANLMFPVFNPNGSISRQASNYFHQCQIQIVPVDDIGDDEYIQELHAASTFIHQGQFAEALLQDARELEQTIQSGLIQKYQMKNNRYPTDQQLAGFASQYPEQYALLEALAQHTSAIKRFLQQPDGKLASLQNLCSRLNQQMRAIRQSLK